MTEDERADALDMIDAARACLAATAARPEYEPRARPPAPRTAPPAQPAVQYRTVSQPPPQPPTVAPPGVSKAWLADMMVEVLREVIRTERSATSMRFNEMERRIATLEQEAERRTAPALRVVR